MRNSFSPVTSGMAVDLTRSPSLSMLEQTGQGAGFWGFTGRLDAAALTGRGFPDEVFDGCDSCPAFFVQLNRKESPKQRRITPVIINTTSIVKERGRAEQNVPDQTRIAYPYPCLYTMHLIDYVKSA